MVTVRSKGSYIPPTPRMLFKYPELDFRKISGGYVKASVPQELLKPVPIYQKESFPLPLADIQHGGHSGAGAGAGRGISSSGGSSGRCGDDGGRGVRGGGGGGSDGGC